MQHIQESLEAIQNRILIMVVNENRDVAQVSNEYNHISKDFMGFLDKSYINALNRPSKDKITSIENALSNNNIFSENIQYDFDGKQYLLHTQIIPLKSDKGFVILQENITNVKELERLSITDELTNLYNRRYFNLTLEQMVENSINDKSILAFLILDIDHFKQYNDTYGHPAGDEVLRKMGTAMKEVLQIDTKYIFRLGGEEFGVLFNNHTQSQIEDISEKLRVAIENMKIPHKRSSVSDVVTASMGLIIVDFEEGYQDAGNIYSVADHALYKAKESGRNQIIIHEEEELELF